MASNLRPRPAHGSHYELDTRGLIYPRMYGSGKGKSRIRPRGGGKHFPPGPGPFFPPRPPRPPQPPGGPFGNPFGFPPPGIGPGGVHGGGPPKAEGGGGHGGGGEGGGGSSGGGGKGGNGKGGGSSGGGSKGHGSGSGSSKGSGGQGSGSSGSGSGSGNVGGSPSSGPGGLGLPSPSPGALSSPTSLNPIPSGPSNGILPTQTDGNPEGTSIIPGAPGTVTGLLPPSATGSLQGPSRHNALSGGAIAGIVIGAVLYLALVALLVMHCRRRLGRRLDRDIANAPPMYSESSLIAAPGLFRSSITDEGQTVGHDDDGASVTSVPWAYRIEPFSVPSAAARASSPQLVQGGDLSPVLDSFPSPPHTPIQAPAASYYPTKGAAARAQSQVASQSASASTLPMQFAAPHSTATFGADDGHSQGAVGTPGNEDGPVIEIPPTYASLPIGQQPARRPSQRRWYRFWS